MHCPYKRAARLRQAILRRVDTHLLDWLHGGDQRATKLHSGIDELIVELIHEVHQDARNENSSNDE